MDVVTIVGARPQFVKLAAVSRVLRAKHREILVHTGQHYDANMSDVFFQGLDLPEPDHRLGIARDRHGSRTGAMLDAIEALLIEHRPDLMLVYGDTDSTLAGALAAAKLDIAIAHVEAGLRSYHRAMPEEINRVLTDHLSALLFAPSEVAVSNLAKEGIASGVHDVGDVMLDNVLARASAPSDVLGRFGVSPRAFHLATIHRAENTDDPEILRALLSTLGALDVPVVLALHPRTKKRAQDAGLAHLLEAKQLRVVPPLPYADTIALLASAKACLTDSGGMQKEAYFLGTPCVTLRPETEWVETVSAGWNTLAGCDPERIRAALAKEPPAERPPLYGDGHSAERIVAILDRFAAGDVAVTSQAWRDRHGRA
jgi:UDP-GlcNAc3NAcA epimerase